MKREEFSELFEKLTPDNQQRVARLIEALLQVNQAEREALRAVVDALPTNCVNTARRMIEEVLLGG